MKCSQGLFGKWMIAKCTTTKVQHHYHFSRGDDMWMRALKRGGYGGSSNDMFMRSLRSPSDMFMRALRSPSGMFMRTLRSDADMWMRSLKKRNMEDMWMRAL